MPMAIFSSRFLTSICVMAVFSRDVPNSAAAVCCCWILVLQIPELSPKMAVCKRFASPGPLNSAQRKADGGYTRHHEGEACCDYTAVRAARGVAATAAAGPGSRRSGGRREQELRLGGCEGSDSGQGSHSGQGLHSGSIRSSCIGFSPSRQAARPPAPISGRSILRITAHMAAGEAHVRDCVYCVLVQRTSTRPRMAHGHGHAACRGSMHGCIYTPCSTRGPECRASQTRAAAGGGAAAGRGLRAMMHAWRMQAASRHATAPPPTPREMGAILRPRE
eukprot:COSAG01_NODE_18561_length_1067_cov_2.319215_1_plen_277_part_00